MVGTSIERWTTVGREISFEIIERGWTVAVHVDAWNSAEAVTDKSGLQFLISLS